MMKLTLEVELNSKKARVPFGSFTFCGNSLSQIRRGFKATKSTFFQACVRITFESLPSLFLFVIQIPTLTELSLISKATVWLLLSRYIQLF
jgi:hypothetical protein